MTIFTKAKLIKILNDKISTNEIKSYFVTDDYLRIQKSKRTGYTFKFSEIPENILVRILTKKTPEPSKQNIDNFYKKEIKRYL
jgi:hypothetical protein